MWTGGGVMVAVRQHLSCTVAQNEGGVDAGEERSGQNHQHVASMSWSAHI